MSRSNSGAIEDDLRVRGAPAKRMTRRVELQYNTFNENDNNHNEMHARMS